MVKAKAGSSQRSFDFHSVGSIPAIPNALRLHVPSLLFHEWFNEASLPAICKICEKYWIWIICIIYTYFLLKLVMSWMSTSSFGGFRLQYRLYHWINSIVILMSSLEGSLSSQTLGWTDFPDFVREPHRSAVHPEEKAREGECAACLSRRSEAVSFCFSKDIEKYLWSKA